MPCTARCSDMTTCGPKTACPLQPAWAAAPVSGQPPAAGIKALAHTAAARLQAAHVAAVLMASLSRLGANAHIARRILKNLAMHGPGRATLRTGAAKWQAQATGSDFASAVGSRAALEWAASRLWAAGEVDACPQCGFHQQAGFW